MGFYFAIDHKEREISTQGLEKLHMKNNIPRAVLLVLAYMQLGAFDQGATVLK